ncbi:hypothetical protein BOW16_12900 [Solemya velum gill symbiont]|nr:hypothetical protein BOW02_12275 [Solemya velum gill symbiont]OOY72280.1 hypothetical protein BOW09_12175 [Solemya velum gill symbiont]OOY74870.1 hypothetical protein BOW10_12115 [Solemya velum gill symbiont]OOY88684.1 hypothetical protein BOW16_12900 [Solemya velum gill symbiont]
MAGLSAGQLISAIMSPAAFSISVLVVSCFTSISGISNTTRVNINNANSIKMSRKAIDILS